MKEPLTEKELIENSWDSWIANTRECFLNEALEVIHTTKRALWLARAERAHTECAYWCALAYHCPREKFNVKHSRVENKIMKYPVEWKFWWFDHEEKCRKKAEEYK